MRTVDIHLDTKKTFLVSLDGKPETDMIEIYVHGEDGIRFVLEHDVKDIPPEACKFLGIKITERNEVTI